MRIAEDQWLEPDFNKLRFCKEGDKYKADSYNSKEQILCKKEDEVNK